MHVDGTVVLAAPRAAVWEALLDPAVLGRCIPGCRGFEPIGGRRYQTTLQLNIAGARGSFSGVVELSAAESQGRLALQVDGAASQGRVEIRGAVDLEEDARGTLVRYAAEVDLAGTMPAGGQRLVGTATRTFVGQFFHNLAYVLSEQHGAGAQRRPSSP